MMNCSKPEKPTAYPLRPSISLLDFCLSVPRYFITRTDLAAIDGKCPMSLESTIAPKFVISNPPSMSSLMKPLVIILRMISEVDPEFGTSGLVGGAGRSVMLDGADHDPEDETEDRCGAEGEDRPGGAARAGDGGRSGAALPGSPEPELCVEEAASRAGGAGIRERCRRGSFGSRAGDRAAAREDRAAYRGAGFFSQEVRKMSAPDRRALVDRDHGRLSIRRQCTLLGVARSGVYRPRRPANDNDLVLMRRIDELFTAWPFLGSRRMAALLRADGRGVNRKRAQRLMRRMGIAALGPRPRTTKPAPGHRIFPYLLRGLTIDRPNQVWAADITYVPIGRGFLYLVAVMDWASRAVLAWRLSNTMDVSFCVSALEEALARFGRPEIFNTDQGSQFTSD